MMLDACFFKCCARPALPGAGKCDLHKQRSICAIPDCRNLVFARNLCVRHGGKKSCVYEGCQDNVRVGDLCGKHGATSTRKLCIEPGCEKFAQTKQRCSAHGGGQRCKMAGCVAHARRGGYCTRHTTSRSGRAPMSLMVISSSTTGAPEPVRVPSPPFVLLHKSTVAVNKLSLSVILNTGPAGTDIFA